MSVDVKFAVELAEVEDFQADVLVLKYAQKPYGIDELVARRLISAGASAMELRPKPGEAVRRDTRGTLKIPTVVFLGVPSLSGFRYDGIRKFAARAVELVANEVPQARHLALTLHGVHYGLDEIESLMAEVAGCVDGLKANKGNLERITVVEHNRRRVERMRQALSTSLTGSEDGWSLIEARQGPIQSAGPGSEHKPHIFVAMPFREDMEDTYHFGIYTPVHDLGYVCERIDHSSFVGDIVLEIRRQVESSAAVIADLTHANPNVYLEVGYAWGRGIPTILLIKESAADLQFDVKSQRCLIYKTIKSLSAMLTKELEELRSKRTLRT